MHLFKSSLVLSQAVLPMAQQLQASEPLQQLYLTSYAGNLTQLSFNLLTNNVTINSTDNTCGPSPTWLTQDKDALYCLGESAFDPTGRGSVSSYSVCPKTGHLTPKSKQQTDNGPVSSTVYHPPKGGAAAIALAHYGAGNVTTFSIGPDLGLSALQSYVFPNMTGPVKERQAASHPHEAIQDPTGTYILVPDLGNDQVHVFSHDADNKLTELEPLNATAGSGPRHAAFWSPINGTANEKMADMYFYLVAELGATVTGYKVDYKPDSRGLDFKKLFESDTLGRPNQTIVAPAEIAVSPDNRFLLVSNRNDSSFANLPNPDTHNATKVNSDSISSWTLAANGSLANQQLFPVGGRFPRQFQINPDGDRVAVVLQNDNRLSILSRDVKTGAIGSILAYVPVPDQPTCVVWGGVTN